MSTSENSPITILPVDIWLTNILPLIGPFDLITLSQSSHHFQSIAEKECCTRFFSWRQRLSESAKSCALCDSLDKSTTCAVAPAAESEFINDRNLTSVFSPSTYREPYPALVGPLSPRCAKSNLHNYLYILRTLCRNCKSTPGHRHPIYHHPICTSCWHRHRRYALISHDQALQNNYNAIGFNTGDIITEYDLAGLRYAEVSKEERYCGWNGRGWLRQPLMEKEERKKIVRYYLLEEVEELVRRCRRRQTSFRRGFSLWDAADV